MSHLAAWFETFGVDPVGETCRAAIEMGRRMTKLADDAARAGNDVPLVNLYVAVGADIGELVTDFGNAALRREGQRMAAEAEQFLAGDDGLAA